MIKVCSMLFHKIDPHNHSGLGKLVGSMCAVSGVLVLSLPIPIIAGNFEAFHKNQQKMTKAEKGKKKLTSAKIAEYESRQQYCNNKMTSCPSARSPDLNSVAEHFLGLGRNKMTANGTRKSKQDTFLYC